MSLGAKSTATGILCKCFQLRCENPQFWAILPQQTHPGKLGKLAPKQSLRTAVCLKKKKLGNLLEFKVA